MVRRILSVDWDYFFPTKEDDPKEWMLYDWGHNENWNPLLLETLWYVRAEAFVRNGLPMPMSSGEEVGFWENFKFSPDAKLYVADSHVEIFRPETSNTDSKDVFEVYNYDAHHDLGYGDEVLKKVLEEGKIDCSNWGVAYSIMNTNSTIHVRYPGWRKDSPEQETTNTLSTYTTKIECVQPNEVVFDDVFIARSGCWTPPWLDEQFIEFVQNCPIEEAVLLKDNILVPREFDMEQVHMLVEQTNAFKEQSFTNEDE